AASAHAGRRAARAGRRPHPPLPVPCPRSPPRSSAHPGSPVRADREPCVRPPARRRCARRACSRDRLQPLLESLEQGAAGPGTASHLRHRLLGLGLTAAPPLCPEPLPGLARCPPAVAEPVSKAQLQLGLREP